GLHSSAFEPVPDCGSLCAHSSGSRRAVAPPRSFGRNGRAHPPIVRSCLGATLRAYLRQWRHQSPPQSLLAPLLFPFRLLYARSFFRRAARHRRQPQNCLRHSALPLVPPRPPSRGAVTHLVTSRFSLESS